MTTSCACRGEYTDPAYTHTTYLCEVLAPDASGLCPDCGLPLFDHLSADECEAHGIDAGLRDGLGCAVIRRVGHPSDCSICWVDFVAGSRSDHAYAPSLKTFS